MDFMNLNQSAHGDREFGFIADAAAPASQDGRRPLERPRRRRADRRLGARRVPAARGEAAPDRPFRRQHAPRRGHRGRQGRGGAEARRLRRRVRRGRSRRRGATASATPRSRSSRRRTRSDYELVPELRPGGDRHESLRAAARIEVGLRGVPRRARRKAFTDTFEDLGGLPQLPGLAVQRLMADGYGFGAEGDWKAAALVRVAKVMARRARRAGRPSWRTTRTTSGPAGRASSARTCSRSARRSTPASPPARSIRSRSAASADPVRLVFTAPPGPAVVVSLVDLGHRFRLVANEVDIVRPDEELPRLPVARAVWSPRPDFATAAEALAARRRLAPHRAHDRHSASSRSRTSPR